jgi:hypothetical protein
MLIAGGPGLAQHVFSPGHIFLLFAQQSSRTVFEPVDPRGGQVLWNGLLGILHMGSALLVVMLQAPHQAAARLAGTMWFAQQFSIMK